MVFNRIESECDETVLMDNIRITGVLGGVPILGELPHLAEAQDGTELFRPIGEAFRYAWKETADG